MSADGRPACPYAGPRSFRTGERLHGRDREIAELLDLVVAQRIVLLVAPSGAGKTSLVQAGLVPSLSEEGFQVLPSARVSLQQVSVEQLGGGNRYVASLVLSLQGEGAAEATAEEQAGRAGLAGYLDRIWESGSDEGQVLLLDQFEEILTADPLDHAGRVDFFRALGEALRSGDRWALISMREDHLAALDPYLRYVPTRLRARYRLELLDEHGAVQALIAPASEAGVEFDAKAAQHLVNDLRCVNVEVFGGGSAVRLGPTVEPLQLQVVASRLWRLLPEGESRITEEHVAAAGDVDAALASYYADGVAGSARSSGVAERALRDWMERRLITEQGTRGQVLRGRELSEGLPNAAAEALMDSYLLRSESRLGATWLELSHDRLIEPVLADNASWRELHLSEPQRWAMAWDRSERSKDLTLSDADLERALSWSREMGEDELTPIEREYVDACTRESEQRATRRRQALVTKRFQRATVIGAVMVAVMAVAGFVGAHRRATAARLQQAQLLSSTALDLLESRPPRALLLALEACTLAGPAAEPPGVAAEHALRQVVLSVGGVPQPIGPTNWASCSADGARVALAPIAGPMRLWDLSDSSGPLSHELAADDGYSVAKGALSDDGTVAVAIAHDGRVLAWQQSRAASEPGPALTLGDGSGVATAIAASGARAERPALVAAGTRGGVEIHSLGDGSRRFLAGASDTARVTALAFRPDQRFVAAGYASGALRIWALDRAEESVVYYAPLHHQQIVTLLRYSPDGELLASGSLDDSARLLMQDPTSGTCWPAGGTEHGDDVLAIAFSPDGRWFASGSRDGSAGLLRVKAPASEQVPREQVTLAAGEEGALLALRFVCGLDADGPGPKDCALAIGGRDNSLRIWSPWRGGDSWKQSRGHEDDVLAIGLQEQASGQQWLVSLSRDETARVWDPDRIVSWRLRYGDHDGEVLALAQLPAFGLGDEGQRYLAAGGRSPALWLRPQATPETRSLEKGSGTCRALVHRTTDSTVLAGVDNVLSRWPVGVDVGSEREVLMEFEHDIMRVALSSDESLLAVGTRGGAVHLLSLDSESPVEVGRALEMRAAVTALAFAASGGRLAAASEATPFTIWTIDATAGPGWATERVVPSSDDPVLINAVAFERSGRRERVAVGGRDGVIRLFDMADLQAPPREVGEVETGIHALAFSPRGGHWLASGGEADVVRVWSVDHREVPPLVLTGPQREVVTLAFSPDGSWMAAGSPDGFAWSWFIPEGQLFDPMPRERLAEEACRIAGRNLSEWEWTAYVDDGAWRATCPSLEEPAR